jgi:hypothetical protein
MLWMIDLLVKDLPGVDYPLLVRIWEHFDVAAACIVFLCQCCIMVTFLLMKSHALAIAGMCCVLML